MPRLIERARGWLASLGQRKTWREAARRRGLIPVLCDWQHLYAIDADGHPVRALHDDWRDMEKVADPRMRHLVLAQAVILDPRLEHLRPVRQPGDPECAHCQGRGSIPGSRRICRCGGTGWLPIGVADEAGS